MAASISTSINACLSSFNEFVDEIRKLQKANVGLVAGPWEDELGRLRVWAANIGAHKTGQSSLDFRLRDASHVSQQIIKLLQGLLQRLQDARDVLVEDGESGNEEVADSFMEEDEPKTELQELQGSLATAINCLFQMSLLVRKPAPHDMHLRSKRADVAAFEPIDYNHVRDQYPRADEALVKRLGRANVNRRKYLKYRETHALKLRQGIDNVSAGAGDIQDVHEGKTTKKGTISIMSDTVATEFQHQDIEFDDGASDKAISQTSYASTLRGGGSITIPPPPESSLGGTPFECPYCFCLIAVHGTRSWDRHVFQDLQPYICIAPTCATPDKLYSTRHEWVHHLEMAHLIAAQHGGVWKEIKVSAGCPLCGVEVESGRVHSHLARHLQELALFVLPRIEDDPDISKDQDAESTSSAESATYYDQPKPPDNRTHNNEASELAVKEYEMTFGREHPHTLDRIAALAVKHRREGRLEEAKIASQQVLEVRERVLGYEHPDTLESMDTLASIYAREGKLTEAAMLCQKTLELRERILGTECPDTLESMNVLAWIHAEQGKLGQAEKLAQQALKGYDKVLGNKHIKSIHAVMGLGNIYTRLGKLKEAEQLQQRVLIAYEEAFGRDAISTLDAAMVLGSTFEKRNKLEEAKKVYSCAVKGYEKEFGRDHELTREAFERLCSISTEMSQPVEAGGTE